jgi:hypothetical protein
MILGSTTAKQSRLRKLCAKFRFADCASWLDAEQHIQSSDSYRRRQLWLQIVYIQCIMYGQLYYINTTGILRAGWVKHVDESVSPSLAIPTNQHTHTHIHTHYVDAPFGTFSCKTTSEVMGIGGRLYSYGGNVIKTLYECSNVCVMTPPCVDFGWLDASNICMLYSTNRYAVNSTTVISSTGAQWCARMNIFPWFVIFVAASDHFTCCKESEIQ